MTQDTAHIHLDERALQVARDAVKSAAAYNPMGDISTVADIAIRAYLSSLPAGDYAGLGERLRARADASDDECRTDDADVMREAATAIAALSAERDAERTAREAAEARVKAMSEALEPFSDIAGDAWADAHGWTSAACPNDCISDWFGPSAFFAARRARAVKEGE